MQRDLRFPHNLKSLPENGGRRNVLKKTVKTDSIIKMFGPVTAGVG